jgi:hypothetical protein
MEVDTILFFPSCTYRQGIAARVTAYAFIFSCKGNFYSRLTQRLDLRGQVNLKVGSHEDIKKFEHLPLK